MNDNNLLFIISLPRSGSTLLQTLLANGHSKINTASEPWLLLPHLSLFKDEMFHYFSKPLAKKAYKDYISEYVGKAKYYSLVKKYVLDLYEPLLNGRADTIIIDKTPRYYEIINEIYNLFPNARFIILRRNPIAIVNSMVEVLNAKSTYDLFAFKRDLNVGHEEILKFENKYSNNKNVRIIDYSNLINNPEEQIGEIYDWLELKYDIVKINLSTDNLKGSFGDNKIKATKMVLKKSNELNYSWIDDNNMRKFTEGYIQYIGESYFESRGYNKFGFKFKKSGLFSKYLKIDDKDLIFFDHPIAWKTLVKYLIYRVQRGIRRMLYE